MAKKKVIQVLGLTGVEVHLIMQRKEMSISMMTLTLKMERHKKIHCMNLQQHNKHQLE
jgi:hypothetical protein